jgi:branched-chain amino acid aminotransferase
MENLVYVNGRFVPREEASVPAFDRSFLYGDGLFETIRAYGGAPFLLDEHLDRLRHSAAELRIAASEKDALVGAVRALIEKNGLADAYVRLTLSRGTHAGALVPDDPPDPTVVVEARPLHPYPAALYERGAAVIVSSLKHDSASPVRRHKTTSYLTGILARSEAKERGADEALLLDHDGIVAEGATSNLFCLRDGRLVTPPLGLNILPGITRGAVLRLAREANLPVDERPFGLEELGSAAEVFLTNSLMELMPVRAIDAHTVPAVPGPATRALANAYRALTPRG